MTSEAFGFFIVGAVVVDVMTGRIIPDTFAALWVKIPLAIAQLFKKCTGLTHYIF